MGSRKLWEVVRFRRWLDRGWNHGGRSQVDCEEAGKVLPAAKWPKGLTGRCARVVWLPGEEAFALFLSSGRLWGLLDERDGKWTFWRVRDDGALAEGTVVCDSPAQAIGG